jgi:hypothetical protein
LSAEDKPGPSAPPPPSGVADANRDQSTPSLDELDSAWSEEEELDQDATMVAKVPLDLVALSRRGTELEKKPELPEKHEAITARPPPLAGEASVVVDAPHQSLPKVPVAPFDEDDEDEDDEEELAADDLDAGWDIEEERAVAADVAAGLDAEARKKAAEARAAQRKEKLRAKKIAAKDKRKARRESIRLKQKKPRKRSVPPPRESGALSPGSPIAREARGAPDAEGATETTGSREFPTIPPKDGRASKSSALAARRDLNRMVLFVAIVVVIGALVIGLARR